MATDKVKMPMNESPFTVPEMDNPLAKLDEIALAYFAGLVDGEGTITIIRTGQIVADGGRSLRPQVEVTNTNPVIVQHVIDTFYKMGAKPYIDTRASKNNWKAAYKIVAYGLNKSKKVLTCVMPYLLAKKAQAELVLEFIESRNSQPYNCHYTDRDLNIYRQIRTLNHRGLASETEDYGSIFKHYRSNDSPTVSES